MKGYEYLWKIEELLDSALSELPNNIFEWVLSEVQILLDNYEE